MKKLILASISALALLGVAACSDSGTGTDNTTTQSTNPPANEQPMKPASPDAPKPAEPAPATNPAPAAPAQ
ncbi:MULTISPECIES: hypothetical protein [unclassified Mesorhizobium]|uniref:hypothetical protein n=1 Tax=unclassified Mesorhizobium TaxID=325217 RepID=UPI00112DA7F4|nr:MULTISPECIES: hypothetical protein [unclassified Mesorhizobium]TPL03461.1 hypothetical protein FJ567_06900 [Mesorhizobium sp. B2-4-16]TPL67672.1 hypothetical protein FJ956_18470 [Mesorhizobium sp. B2-4-3]